MASPADLPSVPSQAAHPLRISGRGAIYSLSFDLGPGWNPVKVANRLLKANMATVGGSPSRDELSVGRRVAKTDRFARKSQRTSDFFEAATSPGWSFKQLWRTDRRRTLWLLRVLKGTIFAIVAHRIFFGQTPRKSKRAIEAVEQAAETENESTNSLKTVIDEMRDGFMHQLAIGAFRLRMEQKVFFPRYYLKMEPYIRLEMNHVYFTDGDFETEPIETSLMLHRSGICILTFATPIRKQLDTDVMHSVIHAGSRELREAKISLPIMRPKRKGYIFLSDYNYAAEPEIREGVKWMTVTPKDDEKLSMSSVFQMYRVAVEQVVGRPCEGEWRVYTTLFQGTPQCGCEGVEAKTIHAVDFGQLLVRSRSPHPIQEELRETLLTNCLVTTHAELWVNAGCGIHTYWNRDDIDYVGDIKNLLPIEFAILQYAQLEAIDTRTVNVSVRDGDVFNAQNELATNLPEYGRNLLSDIDAPRVVDALSERLGTQKIYSRLNDRVKVLETIVNTRFTRKQSRRSLTISVLGFAIVLLLLLPRIDEFIRKLKWLKPSTPLVEAVSRFFGDQDHAIIWIYGITVFAVLAVFVAFTFRPRIPKLREKRPFGYPTKHNIVLTEAQPAPDEDAESARDD